MYAIYLYEYGVQKQAFAITDWGYNCNHASGFRSPKGPSTRSG
jgi:hypothetical protein